MNQDQAAVRAVLDALTRAIRDKDAAGMIAQLASDAVTFDLAPPLLQGPDMTQDTAHIEEWFRAWTGPIVSESRDLFIEVDGELAYAYGLQHLTGTQTGGEAVDLWFRATACFRRERGRWRITHMHNSVPFAMDGTEKALLHLKP